VEIILKKDIENLGEYGELKVVKTGYARNYLIPQGLAVQATKEEKIRVEKEKEKYLEEKESRLQEVEKIKEKLEKIKLEIFVKTSVPGKMFGSVTSKDLAFKIYKKSGVEIDKKDIEIETGAIHELGDFDVKVKLGEGITANIKLKISEENASKKK